MTKKAIPKKLQSKVKIIKLIDKKITDILPYLFDANFLGTSEWIRTGERKFTLRVRMQKKTAS